MSDHLQIAEFLTPLNRYELSNDEGYKDRQLGKVLDIYEEEFPDLDEVQVVLLGCGEQRGSGMIGQESTAPEAIRRQLYQLFYWHTDIRMADIGNIRSGSSFSDTYAAMKMVVNELVNAGKLVIILGGSHDLTLAQYQAYASNKRLIEAACVDALIDLNIDSPFRHENFLMEMLTGDPNYVRHYNHIAFQSYYVHPRMLETMDKLRFDCYRVGHVKENIDEMEPALRGTNMLSFDVSALARAFAPANRLSRAVALSE